jgi:ubiquinone/menaquinone biosynthesis C-methylase UbiE
MNQPPPSRPNGDDTKVGVSTPPPLWRRPRGVAAGTWQYVNERSIADRYDQFVADTPLCDLDSSLLKEIFPVTESDVTILDLGCGSGRSAVPLAERGYKVVGVDLSLRMLAVMMGKTITHGQILPIRCNLVDLDCLRDQSVDHAICMFSTLGMIQGSAHRQSCLQHVSRIVRPGGRFVIHVHNRWAALREPRGLRSLAAGWLRSIRNHDVEFGDAIYQYRGLEKMFMHRFSKQELVNQLTDSGWKIERLLHVSLNGSAVAKTRAIAGGYIAVCIRSAVS